MREHRKFVRLSVNRPLQITSASGTKLTAKLENVSTGGAGILSPVDAEVGAVLELRFTLLVSDKNHDFVVKGTVRHSHLKQNRYFLGIEFLGLDQQNLDFLESFTKDRIARGLADTGYIKV